MTDLSPTSNAADANVVDAARVDLELQEAWRAAAADGFDTEFGFHDGFVECAACGESFAPRAPALVGATAVRDSASGRDDLQVLDVHCPNCATAGRVVAAGVDVGEIDVVGADVPGADVLGTDATGDDETDVDEGARGAASDRVGAGDNREMADDCDWTDDRATDRELLEHIDEPRGGGTLREQGSLVDAEGDDVREYTGEPVETDEGWVLPQQQNVGPGNEAGGGEWPDPDSPPAQTPPRGTRSSRHG